MTSVSVVSLSLVSSSVAQTDVIHEINASLKFVVALVGGGSEKDEGSRRNCLVKTYSRSSVSDTPSYTRLK